jgi:3-dehydroquinate synthase
MRTVQVETGGGSYPIIIGREVFPSLADRLPPGIRKVLLVSDGNVFPLFGDSLARTLAEAGLMVKPYVVDPGEKSKTLRVAEALYTVALEAGLGRGDLVAALGGGVAGDLAGFVAATYMRGVAFLQVPTTLLAQVDSSVGGKVGVNHPLGKNLIGAFHQPVLVAADLATLDTLPRREFLAGAAEVVKYGAALSEPFLRFLEQNWEGFMGGDHSVLAEVVATCCRLKAEVVARDERETGERALLNFGHTLGHALEAATGYSHYLHGEAVTVGMVLDTLIAREMKVLPAGEADRLLALLYRLGLRPPPPGLDAGPALAALRFDKKRAGGSAVFILPVRAGAARVFGGVEESLAAGVLAGYLDGHLGEER